MSNIHTILLIAVLALSVLITRFLPFAVFRKTDSLPASITYLGKVLPAAMMGLLVVYCFKDYSFTSWSIADMSSVLPAAIASAVVVAVHLLKRNTILSIFVGTAVYMLIVNMM